MHRTRHPLIVSLHPSAAGAVLATLLAAAFACWLAIGVGHASAAQVKCGDTITTDKTLRKDLINCPNNGILIGADHVTLNLNGHKIDGDGAPTPGCDPNIAFCD